MGNVRLECPECHKVYQIPEERLPSDKEVAFPCPVCKAIIRLARPGAPAKPLQAATGKVLRGEALREKILGRIPQLPPMPQTVFKAREILKDAQSSLQELGKILETDQGIATKVLKMANSPFYGVMGRVSSLQHASAVLGYKTLAEIVSLAGASTVLGNMLEGYQLSAGDLWMHSLGVAFGSKLIAARKRQELLNDAFTAGLIHDVGKLVLDPYIKERKDAFDEFTAGEENTFLKAEKQILGFDHAEIASDLCKAWNVPGPLIRAVRYHHSPQSANGDDLAHIVHLADGIAMMSGIGVGVDGLQYELDDRSMQILGIREEEISEVMSETVESVQRIESEMKT